MPETKPAAGATALAISNLAIAAVIAGLNIVLLFVLPAWLLPQSVHWAWLLVPIVLSTITMWALIHEGIHGGLHPDQRVNEILARGLGVLFGAPFHVVRFGHLSHHSLNGRAAERPEVYDPRRSPWWRSSIAYYPRLVVGLYAAEVASGPLSLLPRRWLRPIVRTAFYEGQSDARNMAERAERQLLGSRLWQIRLDALLVLALLATSLVLYGGDWPLLALALLGRAFLVSFMDNAPHYGGQLDDPGQGYDMHLPAPLATLVLNSNFHGTHHRHPNTPWPALPEAFARDGVGFAGGYLRVPWRQLHGPIPLVEADAEAAAARRGAVP